MKREYLTENNYISKNEYQRSKKYEALFLDV